MPRSNFCILVFSNSAFGGGRAKCALKHWRNDHIIQPAPQCPPRQSWAVQDAQFVRRAANIQNAIVGRRAQRILVRELENSAGEKVAGFHEAIPKVSRPGHLRFAPRHSGGEGIKLLQLRFQPEEFAFDGPGIISGATTRSSNFFKAFCWIVSRSDNSSVMVAI